MTEKCAPFSFIREYVWSQTICVASHTNIRPTLTNPWSIDFPGQSFHHDYSRSRRSACDSAYQYMVHVPWEHGRTQGTCVHSVTDMSKLSHYALPLVTTSNSTKLQLKWPPIRAYAYKNMRCSSQHVLVNRLECRTVSNQKCEDKMIHSSLIVMV